MEISKKVFVMLLHQASDGNNRATANLAKELLKADPKKVKLV